MLKRRYTVKISEVEQKAASALQSCFDGVPFITAVEEVAPEQVAGIITAWDVVLRIRMEEGERLVVAIVRRSGQPRYAREATGELLRILNGRLDAYGVFMAPYVAERAAALCREAGIGYVDLAGNCWLAFDHIYIERSGHPNRFSEKRELRSLYAPKASRVLRVLLAHPQRRWKLQNLAEEADVSIGHVSNVKQALLDQEWAEDVSGGLALRGPDEPLQSWASHYRRERRASHLFYTLDSIRSVEEQLMEACGQIQEGCVQEGRGPSCLLTDFSGAERLAPHVRYQRASAYVREGIDIEHLAEKLALKSVPSGANVELLKPYDAGVFYGAQRVGGAWVAHPVQLYLDLLTQRGRGEEAAVFLFSEVIQPAWQQERE